MPATQAFAWEHAHTACRYLVSQLQGSEAPAGAVNAGACAQASIQSLAVDYHLPGCEGTHGTEPHHNGTVRDAGHCRRPLAARSPLPSSCLYKAVCELISLVLPQQFHMEHGVDSHGVRQRQLIGYTSNPGWC